MDRREDQSGERDFTEERSGCGGPDSSRGGSPETADETSDGEDVESKPEWKFVNRMPIYDKISDFIRLSIKTAEQQLKADRRKLRKLQYGS